MLGCKQHTHAHTNMPVVLWTTTVLLSKNKHCVVQLLKLSVCTKDYIPKQSYIVFNLFPLLFHHSPLSLHPTTPIHIPHTWKHPPSYHLYTPSSPPHTRPTSPIILTSLPTSTCTSSHSHLSPAPFICHPSPTLSSTHNCSLKLVYTTLNSSCLLVHTDEQHWLQLYGLQIGHCTFSWAAEQLPSELQMAVDSEGSVHNMCAFISTCEHMAIVCLYCIMYIGHVQLVHKLYQTPRVPCTNMYAHHRFQIMVCCILNDIFNNVACYPSTLSLFLSYWAATGMLTQIYSALA